MPAQFTAHVIPAAAGTFAPVVAELEAALAQWREHGQLTDEVAARRAGRAITDQDRRKHDTALGRLEVAVGALANHRPRNVDELQRKADLLNRELVRTCLEEDEIFEVMVADARALAGAAIQPPESVRRMADLEAVRRARWQAATASLDDADSAHNAARREVEDAEDTVEARVPAPPANCWRYIQGHRYGVLEESELHEALKHRGAEEAAEIRRNVQAYWAANGEARREQRVAALEWKAAEAAAGFRAAEDELTACPAPDLAAVRSKVAMLIHMINGLDVNDAADCNILLGRVEKHDYEKRLVAIYRDLCDLDGVAWPPEGAEQGAFCPHEWLKEYANSDRCWIEDGNLLFADGAEEKRVFDSMRPWQRRDVREAAKAQPRPNLIKQAVETWGSQTDLDLYETLEVCGRRWRLA